MRRWREMLRGRAWTLAHASFLAAAIGCSRSELEAPACTAEAGIPVCDGSGASQGLSVLSAQPLPTLPCDPASQGFGTSPVMIVDSSSVYWASVSGACQNSGGFNGGPQEPQIASVIQRTSLCGGGAEVLVSPESGSVLNPSFAVSAQDAFAILGDNPFIHPPIVQVSLAGGCSSTFVSGSAPAFLAVDATNLYWTDQLADTVMKLPLSGGTPTALTASLGNTLYGLAVDGGGAYVQLWQVGIERIPLEGGSATLLAPTTDVGNLALQIVAAAGNVFWSSADTSTETTALSVVPETGGAPLVLTTDDVYGFATDGANVYWAVSTCGIAQTGCAGALKKVPARGGTPVTLSTAWTYQEPAAVAIDATSVYWTSGNTLMRFTPR